MRKHTVCHCNDFICPPSPSAYSTTCCSCRTVLSEASFQHTRSMLCKWFRPPGWKSLLLSHFTRQTAQLKRSNDWAYSPSVEATVGGAERGKTAAWHTRCVPNRIFPSSAVHFDAVRFLSCVALILTWVLVSRITCRCFALTGNEDFASFFTCIFIFFFLYSYYFFNGELQTDSEGDNLSQMTQTHTKTLRPVA